MYSTHRVHIGRVSCNVASGIIAIVSELLLECDVADSAGGESGLHVEGASANSIASKPWDITGSRLSSLLSSPFTSGWAAEELAEESLECVGLLSELHTRMACPRSLLWYSRGCELSASTG